MPLNVIIDLPADVEDRLRRESRSLDADVKQAYVVELFRQGRLSHYELSRSLGLDRFETDEFLVRQQIWEQSLTREDLEADRQTLERVMGQGG